MMPGFSTVYPPLDAALRRLAAQGIGVEISRRSTFCRDGGCGRGRARPGWGRTADKLIEATSSRWCRVNAPELIALVPAGAVFHKGTLLERPIDITAEPSAAEPETAGSWDA